MSKYSLPNTKISATIMEFGKGVLNALPADYSQSEMEDAMLIARILNIKGMFLP